MVQAVIRWRLAEVMARHQITGKSLSGYLKTRENTVSHWKKAKTMPRIDGDRLNQLLNALNDLADRETLQGRISMADLVDYSYDGEKQS